MNSLLIVPRTLWKLLFLLNFVLGLLVLYPLFYVFLSKEKWYSKAFKLKKIWAKWILFIPGIKVKIDKQLNLKDLPNPCVFCANHASYLDIVISYIVIPNFFVFMGKQELSKAPLFNIFFKNMNILVDRNSNASSHKAFIRAAKEIDKGNSVFIFPEGGISNSGRLRGFKNGAFKLAIDKQIPLVPITFLNNWKLLQNGGFFKAYGRPGISIVKVHLPISTNGMTENDLLPLRTKVYECIQADFKNE